MVLPSVKGVVKMVSIFGVNLLVAPVVRPGHLVGWVS